VTALYFSALGVASISLLLPCVGLSWFVTFGAFCKELIDGRSWSEIVTLFFVLSLIWVRSRAAELTPYSLL